MSRVPPEEVARVELTALKMLARDWRRKLPPMIDMDDLQQAVRVGVCRASQLWSPEHGATFMTYAVVAAQRQVIREIARAMRVPVHVFHADMEAAWEHEPTSLDAPICRGARHRFVELAPDPRAEEPLRRIELESALAILSPREQTVLRLSFADGLALREIGPLVGLSHTQTGRLRQTALDQLRAVLGP